MTSYKYLSSFLLRRMSLAIYAAPFDNEINDNNNYETPISKKRHNKTQKRIENFDSDKVNSVIQKIHNSLNTDDNLGDFKPLGPPVSVGVENTKIKEGLTNNTNVTLDVNPIEDDNMDMNNITSNYMTDKQVEQYYKNLVPNYRKQNENQSYYKNNNEIFRTMNDVYQPTDTNKSLNDKLNYIINLLEEQQDERTENVTEEVILYSFLGIFIIFVVDSFARAGKYVR